MQGGSGDDQPVEIVERRSGGKCRLGIGRVDQRAGDARRDLAQDRRVSFRRGDSGARDVARASFPVVPIGDEEMQHVCRVPSGAIAGKRERERSVLPPVPAGVPAGSPHGAPVLFRT
jgi:hypothetical protein